MIRNNNFSLKKKNLKTLSCLLYVTGYLFSRLRRGDVIIARNPTQPQHSICKRLVGEHSTF